MIGYLIYYRPFSDKLILVTNIISEFCYSCIFTSLMIHSFGNDLISRKIYQKIVIFSVFGCTGVQFCISFYQLMVRLYEIYIKVLKHRNKSIVNQYNSTIIQNYIMNGQDK